MQKANLNCPREKLFVNNLLVERPILPGQAGSRNYFEIKVDVLAVQGEKALVLLPNIMAHGDVNTALVDIRYLN